MEVVNFENIKEQVRLSPLTEKDKEELLAIYNGDATPDLYYDVIIKHILSPDEHPDRLDFILQKVMKDQIIETEHSAANEGRLQNMFSKRVISDIPAWLKDHRLADLEMQVAAQEYIFDRTDIYASNMLMIQYSAKEGQRKDEIDYSNVNGVIIVVLMLKSPKVFKDFETKRYIHRITNAQADTGIEFKLLRQMAFVQLDKALDQFLNDTYEPDEDVELLRMLAMIASVNNNKVKQAIHGVKMLEDMCREALLFSKKKEVQAMLLEEKLAVADWNSNRIAGQDEINDLYSWLDEQGRDADRRKAYKDAGFRRQLLEEYNSINIKS